MLLYLWTTVVHTDNSLESAEEEEEEIATSLSPHLIRIYVRTYKQQEQQDT